MIKRLNCLLLAVLIFLSCTQILALAGDEDIKVYIDNTLVEMKNPCSIVEGVVYVPMEELFFKLGIYMSWDNKEGCFIGTK